MLKIGEIKQVILIRTDLGMGKGKLAAQASHASVIATLEAKKHEVSWFNLWMRTGMKKIALKVQDEGQLLYYFQLATKAKLPRALINDAGHTQLPPGTATAVAIGPSPGATIDQITGNLKLL